MTAGFSSEKSVNDGLSLDLKRVVHRAFRYWYFVLLSVAVAGVIAFLHNRYAKRIYPITASVIVKEAGNVSGAELLYNNSLINFKRNYLNELYILKSYPLMTRVIEEMNFDVSFLREGNILTTEIYGDIPVSAIAIREYSRVPCEFIFRVKNEKVFELQTSDGDTEKEASQFAFGDTVLFDGYKGIFFFNAMIDPAPWKNQTLIFKYTPAGALADSYLKRFSASWAQEGAGVINLSITGSNPRKERDLLQGLINRYQESDLEIKNETATRTVEFISDQLEGISDSLRTVETQLERFKNKNIVTDLTGEALRLYEKLEGLEMQRAQLNINRNYYRYLKEYIEGGEEYSQIILPSSIGISDEVLTELISRMNELQLSISTMGKTSNPLVEESKKTVNRMKKDVVEAVRNQESTDDIRLRFIEKQIREIESQLSNLPIAERTLISIQRNYNLLENLYIFLLQKRSEAAISRASNTSDIVVVNPPKIGAPISPRTGFNYLVALVAGLGLPGLVFFLIEIIDNRIQSREDIEKITAIPFIGGLGNKGRGDNLVVLNEPKSALAESFRALRSNLNYFIAQKDKGVFVISSSISGEGKTFTSINLAAVFSLSGKKTLIVGADMRKPKIFDDFGLSNTLGLSTYLAGMSQFSEVVQHTTFANLDLISGGPVPPNPSELLLSNRMQEFVSEAKQNYDFIIIDTPPLAVVTDAFVISPYADHILFLVRQNYTPRDLLKPIEDYYKSGRLRNVSVVLNDIYRSGGGYGYGYGYTYGYGYYLRSNRGHQGYYQ